MALNAFEYDLATELVDAFRGADEVGLGTAMA